LAHVDGLVVDNLCLLADDAVFAKYPRSVLSVNETTDGVLCNLRRTPAGIPNGEPLIDIHNCQRMSMTSCFAAPGTPVFLGLSGKNTQGIAIAGSDLSQSARPVVRSDEVPPPAVRGLTEPSGQPNCSTSK
jgi:hypothetical protein